MDDIDDFEDDDNAAMVDSLRAKRTLNDASDLAVKLPSFSTGDCSWKLICWICSLHSIDRSREPLRNWEKARESESKV